jgi:receptor protein-tyrosine kinase
MADAGALGASPAAEAFRIVRTNLHYFDTDRHIRTLMVTSAAPGDGKSTIAWNLALTAAASGVRTLVIEADLRNPTLGRRLGLDRTFGLSRLLSGSASWDESVETLPVAAHGRTASITILPSGPVPPNPADLLESHEMSRVLLEAQEQYEFVVIDTPPATVVAETTSLMGRVDGVLLVARLRHTSRQALTRLQQLFANTQAPLLGIVVNYVSGGDGYGYGYGYGYGSRPDSTDGYVVIDPERSESAT